MSARQAVAENVDAYIAGFPAPVRARLRRVRAAIRKAAPEAEERISYQIPTYALKGILISCAAFKTHIGLNPAPTGTAVFNRKLAPYRANKASVRFPLDQTIPYDLVAEMVALRVAENSRKAAAKGRKA